MNYFELYPGDYLRDTTRLTLVEHGAYLRLLMAYYAEEQPLPVDLNELYVIAGATDISGKKAIKKVAEKYFPEGSDGLRHNTRADGEISKASGRMEGAKEKKSNDAERQRRTRERRAALFSELREVGVVPDALIPMAELRALHEQNVTRDASVTPDVTSHGNVTHVTGVNTATTRQTPDPSKASTRSSPSQTSVGLNTNRARVSSTTAGDACKAMRKAGLTTTSPQDPGMLALVDAGVTPGQFAHAASVAVGKGKGFAYALGVLKGQLADAASPATTNGKGDPEAIHHRNRAVADAWLETEGGSP